LISQPDPACFSTGLQHLHQRFTTYAATAPQPLPAPGLIITPEIRLQSELYLPIKDISRLFNRLFVEALCHYPILSSTPFHNSPSWADCFVSLPCWLQFSPNPALLFGSLMQDTQLLTRFIFSSFLPGRFNGAGFGRYPEQLNWLLDWLANCDGGSLSILDAACGSGEGTWELAELAAETGWQPGQIQIAGWTLEPLEVWAAQNQLLPHEPERERIYQQRVQPLLELGWGEWVSFKTVDLLAESRSSERFNLILCNGLLGGPILHQQVQLQQVATVLNNLLAPGGTLLVADHFHDGWKKQVPETTLTSLFGDQRLLIRHVAEGLCFVRGKANGGT
jgi:SAM-dependent methyltransferase